MTAPHRRLRDLADVQDLIGILDLSSEFADGLDPSVADEYRRLWRERQEGAPTRMNNREGMTSLNSGTTLGPYRVETLIGQGGMGEVYRPRPVNARTHRRAAR